MSTAPLRPVELFAAEHDLGDFECGVVALDGWLNRSARTAASAGTAAVYVVCRGKSVVGYYALAMSAVWHESAPSRLRRGMPNPVPVILLARLAIRRSEHGAGLGGALLVDALERCVRGGTEFGARAVVVDAIDDNAIAFYEHFDFHRLDGRRLWRRIGDIAAVLGERPRR